MVMMSMAWKGKKEGKGGKERSKAGESIGEASAKTRGEKEE